MTKLLSPIRNARITSRYGNRTLNGKPNFHYGIDFAPPKPGTRAEVIIPCDGTIVRTVTGRKNGAGVDDWDLMSGNRLVIQPFDYPGIVILGHVTPFYDTGMTVLAGMVGGQLDLSGQTTGYHCHFQVQSKNEYRGYRGARDFLADVDMEAIVIPEQDSTRVETMAWQKRQNTYGRAGLIVDGDKGKYSKSWERWVKELQRALNQWRAVTRQGKLRVDGDYGPATDAAVYAVQSNNLSRFKVADRYIGPNSIRILGIPDRPRTRA